ncbi:STAS domain-containing protein [Leptothoe kymatousa]|uniref:STAS domain-containing protein n=1 Tax=Leptothoe kymatousa TAU-MAC 1615 TaxID=2364775 RepID=A0ABS5Y0V5_9CYAN|nr:STAS domain-containing protein [Leptothoe kymatousa]MBT9311467.1 STAS domain-containing protein [Leptothoe kymatousa TAU-MAC 1615]
MANSTSQAIIRLPKRLDSFISPFFAQDLKQKLRPGVTVTIDMANTQFIEPATASVFWDGVLHCQKEGCTLVAKGMNQQVSLVLERSGLLPHLQ